MAIRITHGRADTIVQAGEAAGKADQQVRNQALQLQADLQGEEQRSRLSAAKIQASTTIEKAVLDSKARMDISRFESYMKAEGEKRQIAWGVEQIESKQRHDFELATMRKDMSDQMIIEEELRKKAKEQTWYKAVDEAHEAGQVGDADRADMYTAIALGQNPGAALGIGKVGMDASDLREDRRSRGAADKTARDYNKPEAVEERKEVALKQAGESLMSMTNNKHVTPEDASEIIAVVNNPASTIADIKRAKQVVDAGIREAESARMLKEKLKMGPSYSQAALRTGGL